MILSLVLLLPQSWQPKAKAIIAGVGTVLAVVVAVLPSLPDWAPAVLAALVTLGVYATPAPRYIPPVTEPTP